MISFSNEQIEAAPRLGKFAQDAHGLAFKEQATTQCHICGKRHKIKRVDILAYITCGKRICLIGLNNRDIRQYRKQERTEESGQA